MGKNRTPFRAYIPSKEFYAMVKKLPCNVQFPFSLVIWPETQTEKTFHSIVIWRLKIPLTETRQKKRKFWFSQLILLLWIWNFLKIIIYIIKLPIIIFEFLILSCKNLLDYTWIFLFCDIYSDKCLESPKRLHDSKL